MNKISPFTLLAQRLRQLGYRGTIAYVDGCPASPLRLRELGRALRLRCFWREAAAVGVLADGLEAGMLAVEERDFGNALKLADRYDDAMDMAMSLLSFRPRGPCRCQLASGPS
jgi:hypothetical protein